MDMKVARYYGNKDIRVESVASPFGEKLMPNQVLVKPILCGICGTDLHEYTDGPIVTPTEKHSYTGAQNPQILGHEFSATVESIGSDVTNVRVGDRVSIQPLVAPANDYFSRRGLNHLSEDQGCIGLNWKWGGMAEYAIVNDYNANKLPDNVSDVQGAVLEPGAVALYGVERAGVYPGCTVLVTGAGPIGALTVLAAKAAGASKVFVSELNSKRRELMDKIGGATEIFDPSQVNVAEEVRAHTEDKVGVDISIECVGNEQALNLCVDAVKRGGCVTQVGLHVGKALVDPMLWALKDLRIEATWCYPVTIWPRLIHLVESGKFPVDKIVSDVIALDQIVEKGFEVLANKVKGADKLKILVSCS